MTLTSRASSTPVADVELAQPFAVLSDHSKQLQTVSDSVEQLQTNFRQFQIVSNSFSARGPALSRRPARARCAQQGHQRYPAPRRLPAAAAIFHAAAPDAQDALVVQPALQRLNQLPLLQKAGGVAGAGGQALEALRDREAS